MIIHGAIPHEVSPFATACVTSLIGAALLWGYFRKRIVATIRAQRSVYIRRIVLLGVPYAIYNVLYLIGLEYFDVSTGAFTASMTAVILPVMIFAMKHAASLRTWISAGLVFLGIVIAIAPSIGYEHVPGLVVMTIGALIRAFYIVKLNDYAKEHDPITLSAGLLGVGTIVSFIPWCVMEPGTFLTLPWGRRLIATYFVYAYFIVAFATVLNVYAQRRATAAHATIIYALEIVFSTIWAIILPDAIIDPVNATPPILVGCLLVVAGNLLEIFYKRGKDSEDAPEQAKDTLLENVRPYMTIVKNLHSPLIRRFLRFLALLAVYPIIAMPFKVLEVIPGFADVRPVYMLYPVYGIFFGLPGCFACGAGNLIADILSDSLRWSSIAGLIANFVYPLLLYLIWEKLTKKPFHLHTRKMLAMFSASVVICALSSVAIITPAVAYHYSEVNLMLFATAVFFNTTIFPIGFSVPFIILIQEELGYQPAAERNRLPQT